MSPIRVLYLLDHLVAPTGGSEQHLRWLLRALPLDDFELHVVATFDTRTPQEIASDSMIDVTFLASPNADGTPPSAMSPPTPFVTRFRRLVRLIRQNAIDVVHVFTPNNELVAAAACRFAGRGRVCAQRRNIGYALPTSRSAISTVRQWVRGFAICRAGIAYIANSRAAIAAAEAKESLPPRLFTLIPNPVARARYEDGLARLVPRSALAIPDDAPIVGMVATVRRIKGYEVLLRAARRVADTAPQTRFVLVGAQEAPYASEMRQLAASLGLTDTIVWYGAIDNPFRLLPHFTVGVLSSHSESMSNAVLEYAVAGLPFVATDVGGVREILGDSGLIVPPNDPDGLAERILELLGNEPLRKRLGTAVQSEVTNCYAEEHVIEAYRKFYANVARLTTVRRPLEETMP